MVFTLQVGELDRLKGLMDDEAINVFRNIFGQCNAELEHRGDVFVDELTTNEIGGPGIGSPGIVLPPGWTNVPPYEVPIQPIDPEKLPEIVFVGDPIIIIVPPQPNGDPNMQPGDIIWYINVTINIETGETKPIVITDVIDLPIGSIIPTTSSEVPPGWSEFGDLAGKFPVGWKDGDEDFGTIGQEGGTLDHDHLDHNVGADPTGPTGGIYPHGEFSGTTQKEALVFNATATGSVTTGGINESPLPRTSQQGITVSIADHPDHSHTVVPTTTTANTSPPNRQVGDGAIFASNTASLSHGNTTGGDHDHAIADHTHDISNQDLADAIDIAVQPPDHDHDWTVPELPHIGTLSHSREEHIPPYYTVKWIQRTH